jgi:hypothetical protein
VAILEDNFQRIAELTRDLSPEELRTPPSPGEWTAVDVLAHLRSCADVWGDCMAVIISQDRPTIRAMDPRTWTEKTDYRELEFQPSFQAFTAQRTALLALLRPLGPEDWKREADIRGAGKPLVRSVHFYARWLATHERTHVKQIQRLAAAVKG